MLFNGLYCFHKVNFFHFFCVRVFKSFCCNVGYRLQPGLAGTGTAIEDAGSRDQCATPRADRPTTIKSKR